MAYNSSKGPQTHGDVKYEGDAEDTKDGGGYQPPA